VLKWLYLSRRRRTVAVLVLAAGVAIAADPSLVQSAGLDVWNVRQLEQEAQAQSTVSHQLTLTDGEIQQRIALKEVLIADLIEGRATLAEVTAQFMALNECSPGCVSVIRKTFPGQTDQEKTARNVIDYVRARISDPVQRAQVLVRLEGELARMTETAEPVAR
jgi:hypothetical protein